MDSALAEPFERMIAKLFPPQTVRAIERGERWDGAMTEIERSGFLDLLRPEAEGGAGLALDAAVPLFMGLGRHLAPLEIGEEIVARADADEATSAAMTAIAQAAAIAGAAERILAMTVAYANERVQFGKPIGRQQAVQQQLAVMAEQCIAVRIAVQVAAADFLASPQMKAAVAQATASAFAPRIANAAHAIHGAIGISAEYDLQLYTRRLHRWRVEGGAETLWHTAIGEAVLHADTPVLDWVRSEVFVEVTD